MAIQLSVSVRNSRLDIIESTIGTSAILQIRSGAAPANCATADSGTLLASMTLPSDWLNAASSGTKTKAGTWSDSSADATGTAGHFRIKDSTGTTTHLQGTVTATGGGGDMTLTSTSITSGQVVTVDTFTITEGNS
jgi:hypothetical protein